MPELSPEVEGLSSNEIVLLKKKYGPNSIEEKKRSILLRFIGWVTSPMSLMFIVAGGLSLWAGEQSDAIVIAVLFITNIGVGAWHEAKADNAIEKLKEKLTVIVKVFRDKEWKEISSTELVPGDIIELTLGDIVPADIKFLLKKIFPLMNQLLLVNQCRKKRKLGKQAIRELLFPRVLL